MREITCPIRCDSGLALRSLSAARPTQLRALGLMFFKYGIEALVIWFYASAAFMPWHFLNPVLSIRTEMLQSAPQWLGWALFVWSLPFLWIAMSMSVRRAADSGASPWLGLLVLVPLVNLMFMVVMCLLPTAAGEHWSPQSRPAKRDAQAKSAAVALGASLMIGAVMMSVSVYLLKSYGASLYLGTPLLMGAIAAYLHNRTTARGYLASAGLGMASLLVGGVALLLFALEGLICVLMAVPLMLPLGALGGLLGKAIADSNRRPSHEMMAVIVMLPILAAAEAFFMPSRTEYEVMTAVEIDAPPESCLGACRRFPGFTAGP